MARPRYRMEIVWSDEDEAYVVTVPDLPGCVTHGATYAEAARMGEEAISSWLVAAEHWGTPIPPPPVPGTLAHTIATVFAEPFQTLRDEEKAFLSRLPQHTPE